MTSIRSPLLRTTSIVDTLEHFEHCTCTTIMDLHIKLVNILQRRYINVDTSNKLIKESK